MSRTAPLLLALLLALAACANEGEPDTTPAGTAADADSMADLAGDTAAEAGARATIQPLGDAGASGTVTFMPAEGGLQVTYALDGLTPGRHGFHVHQNGDCGPGPDGQPGGAAGEHFSPSGSPHGAPTDSTGRRHEGDLGNVEAGADGRAAGTFVAATGLMLDGANGIVGRAVIVHADEDDLTTQPSGNSGTPVGCGVVEAGMAGGAMPAGALPPGTPTDALPPGHPPIE
jgi:Cu-Zn family superoxide dismutase